MSSQPDGLLLDSELKRVLSLDNIVSTASSFSNKNATAQHEQIDGFRKVGAGACGAIFAQDGKSTVMKLAKSSDRDDLWNDFLMHKLIAEKFKVHKVTTVKIPACFGFIPKDRCDFWEKNQALIQAAEEVCHLPTHVLCSERILPLPEITRHLLIERFCSRAGKPKARADPANQDCLVRVYLGSLKGRSGGMFFSLRNFKIHLNQLDELGMNASGIASSMGTSLAVMHWAAQTDARDVEFALGSVTEVLPSMTAAEAARLPPNSWTGPPNDNLEDFHRRKTVLWLLDFNQVRPITMDADGVAQAVEAFKINDPYYPRPLSEPPVAKALWDRFADSYLATAQSVLQNQPSQVQKLPQQFLQGVIEIQKMKHSNVSAI
ncbi:hypothetical protein FDECE_11836 [Fusarium decemcellulare]|nr:hypothetical protein FDECE_11836 [Fusarium decemcellulare]